MTVRPARSLRHRWKHSWLNVNKPCLLADFDWGPNARGVQIRCDTGTALSFRRDFLWSVV